MPKRDEPRILADLIRMLSRWESACDKLQGAHPESPEGTLRIALQGDAELVEQARAALHRYVVAQGKRDLARRNVAPVNLWATYCFAVGATAITLILEHDVSYLSATFAALMALYLPGAAWRNSR